MGNTKKVTTRMVTDYDWEATNAQGNTVKIDMYPDEEKQHQSPMDLVLSAVTSCAAVDLVQMLKKRRRQVDNLVIESEGHRMDTDPKYYHTIDLHFILTSPNATEEEMEKYTLLTVEKYCSVSATLNSKLNVTTTVERP